MTIALHKRLIYTLGSESHAWILGETKKVYIARLNKDQVLGVNFLGKIVVFEFCVVIE